MKLKGIAASLLTIIIALNLSACDSSSKDNEALFLEFSSTPSALYQEENSEDLHRFSQELNTEFPISSTNYGNIIPFIGKYLTYKLTDKDGEHTVTAPLYGFCYDEEGIVIVDPVYNNVERITLADGNHFYQLYIDSGVENKSGKYMAVASDGTWKIDLGKNSVYSGISGDGTIAFERTRVISKTKTNYYYDFYNLSGKKLFTFEPLQNKSDSDTSLISNFSDGFAAVNETKTDGKTTTHTAYYINKKGNIKYKNFTFAGDFQKGYAVVADNDGLYGVIDTKGEYLLKPSFKNINYNADLGLFACEGDDVYTIYNINKEVVKTIYCKNSDLSILGKEKKIIEKISRVTNKSEFLLLENEAPFIYSGTGQFPTEYLGDGLYLCDYSNVGYIFNENGESVVICDNFGGIVSFDSDYIVANTKHKDKLIFIDVLAKKILNIVEASYVDKVPGEGIYLLKSNDKYSVYNAANGETFISGCDYAEILTSKNRCFIATVKDGFIDHYFTDFNRHFHFSDGGAK